MQTLLETIKMYVAQARQHRRGINIRHTCLRGTIRRHLARWVRCASCKAASASGWQCQPGKTKVSGTRLDESASDTQMEQKWSVLQTCRASWGAHPEDEDLVPEIGHPGRQTHRA